MIKLIATDMDGTLLDSRKRLPEDILPVIRALRAQGRTFIVASGRQYNALRRDLEDIADDIVFIAENGALIVENDQDLFIDPLDPAELAPILDAAKGLDGVYACVCTAHRALVEASSSAEFIRSMQLYYASTEIVPDLKAACEGLDDVCKVAFFDEGDAAAHELPVLKARLGDRLAVILSGEQWVDVMKPGVNKGRAMRMLMQMKGAAPQDCMAFGDYLNDYELLACVGESYAMANALPEIKAIAKYIAPSNDDNGVVQALRERFAL